MASKSTIPSSLFLLLAATASAQLQFSGALLPAIVETPAASTGLNSVCVLPYVEGVTATYTVDSPSTRVEWQRFNALGGGYAETVPSTQNGTVSTLDKLEGDMGYIITAGNVTRFVWVVDYSKRPFWVADLTLASDSDCGTTWLNVDGQGAAIPFYSINGVQQTLDRDLKLTYSTLQFNSDTFAYDEVTTTESLSGFNNELIHCTPHLCETSFTLSGDRFQRAWGEEQSFTSESYQPVAVQAETSAEQTLREVDNEQKVETTLGGSGPVEIKFTAAVTDAALYHQWQMSSDSEFNLITMQSSDLEFTYNFRTQGTTYVRLLCANDSGDCEYESETYEVFIGESDLQCPNAFSPGSTEGSNDEWRVSYKSIVEFDCHIFDRRGRQLAHLTDPSQGWNGKIGGKVAPAGVYFYVIKATGSDGKKYNLSGDINVVGFRVNTTNQTDN
jgi:gliding motility-associated-like protein